MHCDAFFRIIFEPGGSRVPDGFPFRQVIVVCQDVLTLGRITCMIDTVDGLRYRHCLFETLRVVSTSETSARHRLRTNMSEDNKDLIALKLLKR